jgi:rhamnosyltransferase
MSFRSTAGKYSMNEFKSIALDLSEPTAANTLASVVLFHPEGDLISRLERVMNQVSHLVVVYNDGSDEQNLSRLDLTRITCISNATNQGLAKALNCALVHALKLDYSWCLLLDQDTLVDNDFVEGLASVYRAYPEPYNIGLLAPNYRSPGGTRIAYPQNAIWQNLETAVTSGSLLHMNAVRRVGFMCEDFFIEGIDIEYSLRLRSRGLQLIASGRPLMTHSAGNTEERLLFGHTILVSNHAPWRCFLQFRNLTWILCHYWSQEPHWRWVTLLSILKRYCIVFLFEQQSLRKAWAMVRGTIVGFFLAMFASQSFGRLPAIK